MGSIFSTIKRTSKPGGDLWYLERSEDGSDWEPRPFLQEPSLQAAPKLSPNGRHVAYVSDESGQTEVYVQPFPEGGRKVTVSSGGGSQVRWSRVKGGAILDHCAGVRDRPVWGGAAEQD